MLPKNVILSLPEPLGETRNSKPETRNSKLETMFLHSKLQGEFAESVFVTECLRRGFAVARPHGDSTAYDLLVDSAGSISRVQVKSVSVLHPPHGIYHVAVMRSVASSKKPYQRGDFDLLAAYIIPLSLWYIIPACKV